MDAAVKGLVTHMHPIRRRKLKESLKEIAKDPFSGKPLQEELVGLYSYRVGPLRIIYSLNKVAKVVHVIAIGPRRTIYAESFLLVPD